MKIKDAGLLKEITGNEKIPVSNGSDKPATITVNQILDKVQGTSSNNSLIEVTYEELKQLRDNGQLVPGQQYRMIDYETIIKDSIIALQSNISTSYRSAGNLFDLILTADTNDQLKDECQAIQSIRDVDGYFSNSDLASWKLYYTIDNEKCSWSAKQGPYLILNMFEGVGLPADYMGIQNGKHVYSAIMSIDGMSMYINILNDTEQINIGDTVIMQIGYTGMDDSIEESMVVDETTISQFQYRYRETGSKGAILRMIDEFNNDCPYDFKNIQYEIPMIDWRYNQDQETEGVENHYVYTFNYQDSLGDFKDMSLNKPEQRDLTCKNNVMKNISELPQNIILTTIYNTGRTGSNDLYGEVMFVDNVFDQSYGVVLSDGTRSSFLKSNRIFLTYGSHITCESRDITMYDTYFLNINASNYDLKLSNMSSAILQNCWSSDLQGDDNVYIDVYRSTLSGYNNYYNGVNNSSIGGSNNIVISTSYTTISPFYSYVSLSNVTASGNWYYCNLRGSYWTFTGNYVNLSVRRCNTQGTRFDIDYSSQKELDNCDFNMFLPEKTTFTLSEIKDSNITTYFRYKDPNIVYYTSNDLISAVNSKTITV